MSATQISIKLTRPPSGLTRKVTFDARPSWDELAARIESLYDIPKEHAAVSYVDAEGDDVTMNTQTELQDFYTTQSGGGTIRFVVRDVRAAHGGSATAGASGTEERATPTSQLAENVAHVIASLTEMGGANPEVAETIRNVVRRSAPFWQTGGGPPASPFGPGPPHPPPPHSIPQLFYPRPPSGTPSLPGHWDFPGGPQFSFGRGRGRHHHGPSGTHPRHAFPPPPPGPGAPPPGEEDFASSAPEGAPRAHGRHRHRHGSPHAHGHRHYGPPPPPSSAFPPMDPQAPGAFPPPPGAPPGHEEFVHIPPPHAEDAPRRDRSRSPGLGGANERRRGHESGQRNYRHGGPPPAPRDAVFDFLSGLSFGSGAQRGSGDGRSPRGPPPGPHARGSRGFWTPDYSGESSDEV
ncbi:uncharacterized protein B0H18DRAFT_1119308 [Fomitopsis serialis]|uniref:uncharacterized protein n=1 Tax=Fomitopsis serialis TaxID=139415 RepID=UPI002007E40D|nr:uncharacterized protein B0H18DRAFT_1119308 [Neoantrodia serialis]KAH9925822.1 hypothetical protein B0H18DRAFT_1119308 [Neoantrodia serialis]